MRDGRSNVYSDAEDAYAVALQPNGKIVMAGYTSGSNAEAEFAVVRFNSDGSLDSGFGTGRAVTTAVSDRFDVGSSVALTPDGKIVVAGYAYASNWSYGMRVVSVANPANLREVAQFLPADESVLFSAARVDGTHAYVADTNHALRTACGYEGLDTIVLFSDSAPTSSTSGEFGPRIAQQIFELCRQHLEIPINTIGLGE